MPTISIELKVADGTTVSIAGLDEAAPMAAEEQQDPIERYWREYLSDNGRKIYGAAARLEDLHGPFTLEDIARVLSVDYETALSWHRTSGRSARKWHDDTGTEKPIWLDWTDYAWHSEYGGNRTVYRLPPGVADVIKDL